MRRKPYSVVLLDEVEKAHPDVMELFYQVFDKGMLEDGEGREIDFKNTVILLTSNTATDIIMKLCADPDTCPEPEGLVEAIRPELFYQVFDKGMLEDGEGREIDFKNTVILLTSNTANRSSSSVFLLFKPSIRS